MAEFGGGVGHSTQEILEMWSLLTCKTCSWCHGTIGGCQLELAVNLQKERKPDENFFAVGRVIYLIDIDKH